MRNFGINQRKIYKIHQGKIKEKIKKKGGKLPMKKLKFKLQSLLLLIKFKRNHKKQEEIAADIIKQFHMSNQKLFFRNMKLQP